MKIVNVYQDLEGNDVIVYSDGTSETVYEDGTTYIMGTDGDDKLHGTSADDTINGLAGDDKITGGGGNDTLIGGADSDQVLGGGGDDIGVWNFFNNSMNEEGSLDYYNGGGTNGEQGNDILRLEFTEADLEGLSSTLTADGAKAAIIDHFNASVAASGNHNFVDFRDIVEFDLASINLVATNFEGIEIIEIGGINTPPVAENDLFDPGTNEDTTIVLNVFNNNSSGVDFDIDGDPFEINSFDAFSTFGAEITLVNGMLGTLNYDPTNSATLQALAEGAMANDTFTYDIIDSFGAVSNTATVTVKVLGVNDAPEAQNVSENAVEDGPVVTGAFNADDIDNDDDPTTLTYSILGQPLEGSVSLGVVNGTYDFDPGADFQNLAEGETRDVIFNYRATDSHFADSNTATVTVTVTGVNDAPTAQNVSTNAVEDGPVVTDAFNADDIDSDDDSTTLTYSILGQPLEGSVSLGVVNGTYDFDPGTDFQDLAMGATRDVTFDYQVEDSHGALAMATATVTVTGVNDAPEANDDMGMTDEKTILSVAADGVLGNDTDVDMPDTKTVVALNGAPLAPDTILLSGAKVTLNADGSYDYDPNGAFDFLGENESAQDSFDYTMQDTVGAQSSATVFIDISGVNDVPVADAGPDQNFADTDAQPGETVDLTLDGSGSFDPDVNDTLTFEWFAGTDTNVAPIATGVNPTILGIMLADGVNTFTLKVTDDSSAMAMDMDEVVINVEEPAPLTASIEGDVSVTEGNSGTTTLATITVNLSVASSENIIVRYTTGGGDANPLVDPDYAPNNGELLFLAGETSKTIDVTVFGDNAFEADETFNVTINSVSAGVDIGNQTGVVTIQNDDVASASGLPLLSSNPGASAVLYLDFDGEFVSGTDWNSLLGNTGDFTADAYDIDSNPLTFNAQEQQDIMDVWRVVQEDYAPFDINVTTDLNVFLAANVADRDQVVISTTSSVFVDPFFGSGVAFQDSFGDATQQPAWVFYDVILGSADIFDVGMVASHEAGHQLGLSHDGIDDGMTFIETSPGHGAGLTSWGPIMGAPFGQSVTQWSQGEYVDANNLEDDLSIIAANSFGFRTDDHGDDINNATLLHLDSGSAGQGVIEDSADVDYFEFSGSGNFTIDVNPLEDRVANLDILVELYDENGILLASSNPVNTLDASITHNAATSAKMFLAVSGTGKEPVTATDGYTDYGSLGHYEIAIMGLIPEEEIL